MINDKILDSINEIDDDLLDEALFGETEASAKVIHMPRRSPRRIAAVIAAAVLVLGAGIGVYASGVLTAPVEIYRSAEVEEKKSVMLIDGVEVDHIDINVRLPLTYQGDVKGPIRDEAAAKLAEKVAKDERAWNYGNGPDAVNGIVTHNFYQISEHKEFDDQKDILDFIGLEKLEEQYFPFENYSAGLSYNADLKVGHDVKDLRLWGGLHYGMHSIDEPISVGTWAMVSLTNDKKEIETGWCYTGFGGIIDDGTLSAETFQNSNGYNGAKVVSNEGKTEKYSAQACIAKNDCFYQINLSCDWEYADQAQQILQTWIDSF